MNSNLNLYFSSNTILLYIFLTCSIKKIDKISTLHGIEACVKAFGESDMHLGVWSSSLGVQKALMLVRFFKVLTWSISMNCDGWLIKTWNKSKGLLIWLKSKKLSKIWMEWSSKWRTMLMICKEKTGPWTSTTILPIYYHLKKVICLPNGLWS